MKLNAIAYILLLTLSSIAHADVYKCQTNNGQTTYQALPCAKSDDTSVVTISKAPPVDTATKKPSKSTPSGSWIDEKNTQFKATIGDYGSFSMTDKTGDTLHGKWELGENNSYVISAKFHGMSMPVNMKYDASNDTLRLSKPGFPNSFRKYVRQ